VVISGWWFGIGRAEVRASTLEVRIAAERLRAAAGGRVGGGREPGVLHAIFCLGQLSLFGRNIGVKESRFFTVSVFFVIIGKQNLLSTLGEKVQNFWRRNLTGNWA